jgi:diguanylate cyclase (GGDEF)-like protein
MSARSRPRDPVASRPPHGGREGRPAVVGDRSTGASETSATAARLTLRPGLETELAERLDIVLGIAERSAATHDRLEVFRSIVDATLRVLRVDYVTIRVLRDDRLHVAAWAGCSDELAAALPVLGRDEGWVAEVLRTGRVVAWTDVRTDPTFGAERYDGIIDIAGDLIAPLIHHDRVIGSLSAITRRPRRWTDDDVAFLSTLATHASIAVSNAELFEQIEGRAVQLAMLQAASGRLSRATSIAALGRTVVEETRRIVDYDSARVYLIEPPDQVVPIAFEGRVRDYDQVDADVLRCRLGEGFSGFVAQHGEPLLIDDANADPRGRTIAGTDDVDESMLVVPMRYDGVTVGVISLSKLGLGAFDADDLSLLAILADHAATAVENARLLSRSQELASELRRLLDMSGELSQSLDPRQVATLIAGHLVRAMSVDECAISYWDRSAGRLESLGLAPAERFAELAPFFDLAGYPETLRVLERGTAVIIDADDPAADPAEAALLRADGHRTLAMLPLVAKGQVVGLVEMFARREVDWDSQRLALARTMANEAAMALENARLYEDARRRADRDPLTDFFNHRYLHERLAEEVVRSQRGRRPLSVVMLDLDDFKLVNDSFGHLFGDQVLTWVAEMIRGTLRASDVAARYGGDEFALILPDTDAEAARRAAERILMAFQDRPFVDNVRGRIPVTASIGIATYPDDGRSATDLIAAADRALYDVKRGGGRGIAAGGAAA